MIEITLTCPDCGRELKITVSAQPSIIVAPHTILMLIEHSGPVTCACGMMSVVQMPVPPQLQLGLKALGRSPESHIVIPGNMHKM